MTQRSIEVFSDLYVSALTDVIEYYAGEQPVITVNDATHFENESASLVGFAESRIRGSSVLLAHEDVTRALAPRNIVDPLDWLGELNNQVVGRFKNALARYGIVPHMGTPVTVSGRELDLGAVGTSTVTRLCRWDDLALYSMVAIEIEAEIDFDAIEEKDVAAEGSISLF